ncbi:hypothetical protein ACIGO8_07970 [Streptomyces sp. NPDC053493]|uniref:hypothetical protein n=1 Tax=Streptomyces sp. NPDC053493 TaxID=3365705 RepID=UPI0037CFEB74
MNERTDTCKLCGGVIVGDVSKGCTAYTCTHPCADCGHIGDVHRDWYDPGFCRRCPEGSHHDFRPALIAQPA